MNNLQPEPSVNFNDKIYIPKSIVKKPKITNGGEFVIASTQQFYSGSYVETLQKQYFAGKTASETGIELQKIKKGVNSLKVTPSGVFKNTGLLSKILQTVFIKQLTSSDLYNGKTVRFFIKDVSTGRIVETDEDTLNQVKAEVPNIITGKVEWTIQGPGEDVTINNYKYEGAISRNRKAIQTLEKTIPGISSFVTDYSFLVTGNTIQEITRKKEDNLLSSEVVIVKDSNIELQNLRKANFDKKN